MIDLRSIDAAVKRLPVLTKDPNSQLRDAFADGVRLLDARGQSDSYPKAIVVSLFAVLSSLVLPKLAKILLQQRQVRNTRNLPLAGTYKDQYQGIVRRRTSGSLTGMTPCDIIYRSTGGRVLLRVRTHSARRRSLFSVDLL